MLNTLLLVVHVMSAMVFVGGSVLLNTLMLRTELIGGKRRLFQILKATDPAINISAPLMILSGVGLVVQSELWSFASPFVVVGMVVVTVSASTGMFYFLKEINNLEALIVDRGDGEAEVNLRFRQFVSRWTALSMLYLLGAWAMVVKPEL